MSKLSVATAQNSQLQVFAAGADGLGYTNLFGTGQSNGWTMLGGNALTSIAVAANPGNLLELFAIGAGGTLFKTYQTQPDNAWSGFQPLSGTAAASVIAAADADGYLEAFVIGTDGAIHHIWQTSPGADTWSAWETLGGSGITNIAATADPNEQLEVFAIDGTGALLNFSQNGPDGTWGGATSLGSTQSPATQIVAAMNSTIGLIAFALAGGEVFYNQRSGSTWGGWQPFGGSGFVQLALATNQNGRLELFAIGAGGAVSHIWQQGVADGPWSTWEAIGGANFTDLAVALGSDSELVAFALDTNSALWSCSQSTNWGSWQAFGVTGSGYGTVVSITADSQLIEDYLYTQGIYVAQTARPVSVFMNANGQSEAVVIDNNGRIIHVCREPLSETGWNAYALGSGLSKVVAIDSATAWAINRGVNGPEIWQVYLGRWQQISSAPNSAPIIDIAIGSDGILRGVDGSNLYTWDASSSTWNDAGSFGYQTAPVGRPDTTLFVLSDGQIYYWLSNGMSGVWFLTGFTGACAGFDDSHFFIQNAAAYYDFNQMTDEGGGLKAAWSQSGWTVTSLAALSETEIWVVATDGSSNQVLHGTSDGTSFTWTQVAFTGPNDPAQLSVSADGTLWVLDDVGVVWTFRTGAWQRVMLPNRLVSGWQNTVTGVTEVATLTDDDGDIWVYFIDNGTSSYIEYVAGDYMWQTAPTQFVTTDGKSIASNLHITYDLSNNTPIVYGISADGYLVVGGGGTNFWQPVWYTQQSKFTLAGGDVQLRACGDGTWITYALMPNTEWNGQIMMASGTQANPLSVAWDPIDILGTTPTAPFAALVDVPGYAGAGAGTADTTAVAAIDTSGNMWLISNVNVAQQNANFSRISGAGLPSNPGLTIPVTQAAGYLAQSPDTAMCFLAVDDTDTLWILRLTPQSDGTWTYGAWHPLHDEVTYVAIGPTGTSAYEIFNLDSEDSTLNRLWTDPVSSTWTEQQLIGPAYASGTLPPYYVAQYSTTLTVLNADPSAPPIPIVGFQVSVSVAEPSLVHVAGTAYPLVPGTPTQLTTDNRGQITIKSIALGLHTAQLTFTAPQMSMPFSVYPPQNLQNQLATVSGSDLQNATCQNVPPFPVTAPPTNLPLSPNLTSDDANNAASAINGTISIRNGQAISGGSVGASGGATVLQVNGMAPADAAALGDPFTDFWDDICDVVEDLIQAIKKAIITVESVVVDIEQGVITAVLWFKEVSQATIQFVIKTIHDIEGALISAFQWIESAVEDVINWIKEIFAWGNILAVHRYISAWVSGFLNNLATAVNGSGLATFLNNQISSATQDIENALATLQTELGSNANTTPRSYVPANSTSPMGADPLNPGSGAGTLQNNQVICNYVQSQTTTYANNGGSASQTLGSAATLLSSTRLSSGSPIQDLVNQGSTISNNANFQSGMSVRPSSGNLFDTGLVDLLGLLKDFIAAISDLAEDLVSALIDAAGLALQTVKTVLTGAIDIPLLSWLYNQLTGDQLTLLDLGCLALAFPATVLWAILGGGDFSVFGQLPPQVPWPSIPGALSAGPPVALSEGMADMLPFLSGAASFIAAFLDCASDVANSISPPSVPDAMSMFLGVLDWMVDFVALVLGSPFTLFTQISSLSQADEYVLGQWVISLAVPVIDAVFSFGAQLDVIGTSTMQPYLLTPVGVALVAVGVLALVYTITENGATSKILSAVGSVIGPVPYACKFLLPASWTNPEELDASGVVLGAIDFVCDFASGGLAVASAMTSSADEMEETHENLIHPPSD